MAGGGGRVDTPIGRCYNKALSATPTHAESALACRFTHLPPTFGEMQRTHDAR
jgi:hypothetical protein